MQVPGEPALGFVGELHPLTARRYGFDDPVVVIELDLDRLCEQLGEAPRALPLSEFPPLRQDIAVVVADEHPASAVLAAAREAGRRAAQRRPGLRRLARRRGARPRPPLAGAAPDVPGAGPHALRRGGAAPPRGHRRAPARDGRSRAAVLGGSSRPRIADGSAGAGRARAGSQSNARRAIRRGRLNGVDAGDRVPGGARAGVGEQQLVGLMLDAVDLVGGAARGADRQAAGRAAPRRSPGRSWRCGAS